MAISEEFLKMLDVMKSIHIKKSEDYSGNNDPFFNFDFASRIVAEFETPIDQVFAGIIGIKLARLAVLLNGRIPKNESIKDTFIDAANYFALWGAHYAAKTASLRDNSKIAPFKCAYCGIVIIDRPPAYEWTTGHKFCSSNCHEIYVKKDAVSSPESSQ